MFASLQKVVLRSTCSVLGNPEGVMVIIIFVKCFAYQRKLNENIVSLQRTVFKEVTCYNQSFFIITWSLSNVYFFNVYLVLFFKNEKRLSLSLIFVLL